MSRLNRAHLIHELGMRVVQVVPHPIVETEPVEVYDQPPVVTAGQDWQLDYHDHRQEPAMPRSLPDGRLVMAPCPACHEHTEHLSVWDVVRQPRLVGRFRVGQPLIEHVCYQVHPCGHVVSSWGYRFTTPPPA